MTTLNNKIIGISGTNGAGKDVLSDMLAEKYGFLNITATSMFVEELNKRGLPIDRKHKSQLSAQWRRKYGMGAIVDRAVEIFKHKNTNSKYRGLVVGSLRHPGEAKLIHEMGGKVIWVDADPEVRYKRIQSNLHERVSTHAEAGVSFEQFLADERREMTKEGDEATLDMAGVKKLADIFLNNNGNDVEVFKNDAKKALKKYLT